LYNDLNVTCFDGKLNKPTILISRADVHGHYTFGGNFKPYMAFNPADDKGLRAMRATVYHEMVHQYLEEVLGIEEAKMHGDVFWLTYFLFANMTFDWEEPYE
jgi:hypothetical protein